MANEFYDRKAELIIGNRKWTYPELNMNYKITFDSEPEPNKSQISIYNLSDDSIKSISKGQSIIFNAGYGDDIGTLLAGIIYEVYTIKKGVDNVTFISCIDVQTQYLQKRISKTYTESVTAEFILNDIFNIVGIKLNKLELKNNVIYKNGFVAADTLNNIAKRIVKNCGSQLLIQNTSISVIKQESGIVTGFLLSPSTGLINIDKINKNNGAQYEIDMILNHAISTKSLLEVQSKTFNGIVMAIEGQHSDFKTNVEVVTVG